MTKQITIKLNEEQFQPVLDDLKKFTGEALGETNSDFVAKLIFFCFHFLRKKNPEFADKTNYELLTELKKRDKHEAMLELLSDFARFKKEGVSIYTEENKKD